MGSWMTQSTGETIGDQSKTTLLDPLRINDGSRTLPLMSMSEELDKKLLENSGRRVRLKGTLYRWIEHGRGQQGAQSGYYGPIPAHVVEFLIVQECETIESRPE